MSYTIFQVVRDLVAGKLKFAPSATATERVSICNQCEVQNTKLHTCTACGCWLPAKVRLKESSCPMELW